MESQGLSHRELYHRHLANIHNQKEKKNLESLTKFYDKSKEDKEFAINREEKDLRQNLRRLQTEQHQQHHYHYVTPSSHRHSSHTDPSRRSHGPEGVDSEEEVVQAVYTVPDKHLPHIGRGSQIIGLAPFRPQPASYHGLNKVKDWKTHKMARSHHTGSTPYNYLPSYGGLGMMSSGQLRSSVLRPSVIQIAAQHHVDLNSLEHYYKLLAENENKLVSVDAGFQAGHTPQSTQQRSNRRKILALEALLKQLPSYNRTSTDMDPLEVLNCRYLRLTPQNVDDLEKKCYQMGIDPGLHAHLTPEQVNDIIEDSIQNKSLYNQHQQVMRALQAKHRVGSLATKKTTSAKK